MKEKFVFLIVAVLVVLSSVSCSGASGKTVGSIGVTASGAGIEMSADKLKAESKVPDEESEAGENAAVQDGEKDSLRQLKNGGGADGESNDSEEKNPIIVAGGEQPENQNDTVNAGTSGGSNALTDEEYAVFDGALFIGDSRTEGIALYSGIKNADFFCAKSLSIDKVTKGNEVSVGGTNMSVYTLLDSKKYTKVYISLGLNELGWTYIDKYTGEYTSLINAVKESQPDAEIFVQALLPVTKEKSDKGGTVNNSQIYWYNVNLEQMAQNEGVTYINAAQPLICEDGTLIPDSTTDGVHLKSEYCKIWAKKLAELTK